MRPSGRTDTMSEKAKQDTTESWSRWYADARYEAAFRYGVRGIPKDRYKEHFSLGQSVTQAVREIVNREGLSNGR
jgi:hypothetical protein